MVFPQTYLVEFHGIATFKPQYKFIKQQQFRYFGIWCDYMAFWSSFQPELSSGSLYRVLCIKLFPSVHHCDFGSQRTKYGELQRRLVIYMPAYKHGSSTVHFIPLILVCIYIPHLFLSLLWSVIHTHTPTHHFFHLFLWEDGPCSLFLWEAPHSKNFNGCFMCLEFVQNVYHSERSSHLTELYLQVNIQDNEKVFVWILICSKSNNLAATAINFYVTNFVRQ